MRPDSLLVPTEVVAHEVYAQLSTPLLWRFLQEMPAKGDDWAANTGFAEAARTAGVDDGDAIATFYADVPRELAEEALRHSRHQADRPGQEPWPLDAWPDVPTRYLLCTQDRFFPAAWMRGVVRERLGITPDEIESGHCPALSRPAELADRLEAYRAELARTS